MRLMLQCAVNKICAMNMALIARLQAICSASTIHPDWLHVMIEHAEVSVVTGAGSGRENCRSTAALGRNHAQVPACDGAVV